MRRRSTLVCQRVTGLPRRRAGRSTRPSRQVLAQVRAQPVARASRYDADGRRMQVDRRTAPTLAAVAFGATYAPRVLPRADRGAAVRAAPATARRCSGWSPRRPAAAPTPGRSRDYSEGLDAAVGLPRLPAAVRHDRAARRVRQRAVPAALARRAAADPGIYGAVHASSEYAASDWEALDWCTALAGRRRPRNPAGPPHAARAAVPATCRCSCSAVSSTRSPRRRRARWSRTSSRTPARCSSRTASTSPPTATPTTARSRILRAFVRDPADGRRAGLRLRTGRRRCGRWASSRDTSATCSRHAAAATGRAAGRRAAAAATVADVLDRWWNNYSGHGVGLRGGTLDLHRRPDHLPAARRTADPRPRGERHRDLAAVRQPALGRPAGPRSGPHRAAARRLGDPAARRDGRPCAASSTVTGSWSGFRRRDAWRGDRTRLR